MVRRGRLGWFGHLERSVDDWVSAYRKVEVAGARCKGRKKKTCKNVWIMTWKCLVYILNVRYPGMCGGSWDFIWVNVQ